MQRRVRACTVNSVTTLNNFALIVLKQTISETSESVLFNYYKIIIIIIIIINFFLHNQQSESEAKCRSNTITMCSLYHLLVVLDQISDFVFEITAMQSIRRKITNLDRIT